ncbi:transporter substrate-binding domain-containing protein [Yoonia sediminilitoris]|uniref:Amino acid ABC transporter substrate-binding protein (PAAT family) n=1 Tax=Yoonia sediminilitoris TaxID=1286148 RepID=A0A2T6KAY8_9RHOB|nr:transporter substrate-binding domain-containing protein [Yoonia sediminilitoris]PUB12046.1 amino acid ABC transporter substrate-binding protein (PAAT family) [Yoonia sediminilitoris]RCW92873.1 amino acid ABC transporter substrate-binding protein (PAAT family) [Yoonia sediminilitoris]
MRITRRLFGAAIGAAMAAGIALPAAAQSASQALTAESVITQIQEEGVIRIGLSLFVPWSMRDVNGELIGFELDVGRQLAEDMGVEVEFVPTAWDGIIPSLLAGNFDVIISGMSVTAQRNLSVNFSDPYAFSGLAVLANTELTEGMSLEDMNSPDVTFAARRGATPAAVIAEKFPEAQLLLFDEDGASTQEVLNGNAHASMSAQPGPDQDAARNPGVVYVMGDQLFDARGEGFALRRGDPDALNFFNNWIAQQWRSGWLEERHDYWFVGDDWSDQVAQ